MPRGPGNSLNYEPLALIMQRNGGGTSLVVADGKVFVSCYQPAGTEFMGAGKSVDARDLGAVARISKIGKERKPPITEINEGMKEKFLAKADNVVVCMDAETGKILWTLELGASPSKGVTVFGDTLTATIDLEGAASCARYFSYPDRITMRRSHSWVLPVSSV